MLVELTRDDREFVDNEGNVYTDRYYCGKYQVVLGGSYINPVLEALENSDYFKADEDEILFYYDDKGRCCLVAPELNQDQFFGHLVSLIEDTIFKIKAKGANFYSIRPKIPDTPELPNKDTAPVEMCGEPCHKTTVYSGRGYGLFFSEINIYMSVKGYRSYYQVTRFNNEITGPQKLGEAFFQGEGAQWQAISFAYQLDKYTDREKLKSAQRTKNFVYKVVGELMELFWNNNQSKKSYMDTWRNWRGSHEFSTS